MSPFFLLLIIRKLYFYFMQKLRSETTDTKNQNQQDNQSTSRTRRAVSIAAVIMMGSVLLSRITGLLREQVLANFGGTSIEMDAYVTAFLIPELLNHFLAGGLLSTTFIPIFQKHIVAGKRNDAWKSFSNLLSIGTALFVVVIPVAMILTPDLLGVMGSGISDPQVLSLTAKMTRIILPAQILFYIGAFFSAVQMAEQKFFLPALAPLFYNIGIIMGGIFLGPHLGVEGFAWGVLIGAFLSNILIQLPGAIRTGMKFSIRFDFHDPDLGIYIRKTIPLVLGIGMAFSNEIFFRFFGSFLPEGATSSVNYALRTMMMVVAVFGQSSGVAFYPFLSRMAAQNQIEKMDQLINSVLTRIASFIIPLSVIMMVLSEQIISILFEYGNFTHESTLKTASVFTVYLTGCFTFSSSMIMTRTFYAMQNTMLPMIISTAISVTSIPLYLVFSRFWGAPGIALASVIAMTIQFLVLYLAWQIKMVKWKNTKKTALIIAKIILISLTGAGVGLLIKNWTNEFFVSGSQLFKNLMISVLSAFPSLLIVAIFYELSGVQNIRKTLQIFKRK